MLNSFIKEKLRNLNNHYSHPSYILERKLLNEIRMGLLENAINTLKQITAIEKPMLALETIRSVKNSLIASCTLFTRAIIDAGISPEDAFGLSDVFIKRIESLEKEKEIRQFEFVMLKEFVLVVQESSNIHCVYPISKVVKYIYENANSKITVAQLAQMTHLSPDYLSKLFRKEMGMCIIDYIQLQKVEVAKYFLEFSDMKITDIATLLEFCNPAYFTNVFKKHIGKSPNQYRKRLSQIS